MFLLLFWCASLSNCQDNNENEAQALLHHLNANPENGFKYVKPRIANALRKVGRGFFICSASLFDESSSGLISRVKISTPDNLALLSSAYKVAFQFTLIIDCHQTRSGYIGLHATSFLFYVIHHKQMPPSTCHRLSRPIINHPL